MRKRICLTLFFATFVAGGAFARIPLSVGGGVLFDFESGGINAGVIEPFVESYDVSVRYQSMGFGLWGFLDATFVEFSVGIFGGTAHDVWTNEIYMFGLGTLTETYRRDGGFLALNFSLLGRFPFALGDSNISIFPLLGIGYNAVLLSNLFDSGDKNAFRIKFGAGGDFDFRGNRFLRVSILGFYRFRTNDERNIVDSLEAIGFNASAHGGFGVGVRVGWGVRL